MIKNYFAFHCSLLSSQYNPAIYTTWIVLKIKTMFSNKHQLAATTPFSSQQLHLQFITFSNQEEDKLGFLFLLFALNIAENRIGAIELDWRFSCRNFSRHKPLTKAGLLCTGILLVWWHRLTSDTGVITTLHCHEKESCLAWALYFPSCFGTGLKQYCKPSDKRKIACQIPYFGKIKFSSYL